MWTDQIVKLFKETIEIERNWNRKCNKQLSLLFINCYLKFFSCSTSGLVFDGRGETRQCAEYMKKAVTISE
jgi:hypothetical protein